MSGRGLLYLKVTQHHLFVLITVVLRWREAWSLDGIILKGENELFGEITDLVFLCLWFRAS
jgi:hypothetical protein